MRLRQSQVAMLVALGLIVLCMVLAVGYVRVALSEDDLRSSRDQKRESLFASGFDGVKLIVFS